VTSVIIGPRAPEQLDDLTAGSDVVVSDEVLDRIDETVPPGTELKAADHYVFPPPAIKDKRCGAAKRAPTPARSGGSGSR
jgi:aryl-alcohol dehydrogenase (NADP+)